MHDTVVARRGILETGVVRLRRTRVRVRVAEHDHVAAMRMAEAVTQFVDEDAVALAERRLHRCGRDVERLHEERFDEERDPEGERDEDGELLEEPERASTVAWRR